MKILKEDLLDLSTVNFDCDVDHTFKIGYGPNALINMAPYRACRHLCKELKQIKNKKYFDVYLYNEFARSIKETKVDDDIRNGLKQLKLPIKFYTDKQSKDKTLPSLAFDLIVRTKSGKEIKRYTICSAAAGSYSINGVKEADVFFTVPYARSLEWATLHEIKSNYIESIASFVEAKFAKANFENCIKIMDKLIDDGLKAKGKLPLDYLGVTYHARAGIIYKNKRVHETSDQRMIRLISSYAYAIGEQIVLKKKMVASPTGSTSPVVWSVLRYLRETYHPSKEKIYNALSAAALICNNIKYGSFISANESGCQAAMATATAMATAIACVILYDAEYYEIGRACEMAIEHTLGLICNSVCAVPLVPCIQRTAAFAVRAYELAVLNHSLMKTKQLVHFDDAVMVLDETGKDLRVKYKIAGTFGFAKTARYSLFPNEKKSKKGAK